MAIRKKSGLIQADENLQALLKDAGSNKRDVSLAAQDAIAQAIQLPLRQGIFDGDIVGEFGIFVPYQFNLTSQIEFPLDVLVPGTESENVAYTLPNAGRIPEKNYEGDYLTVPIYDVGNSADCNIKFAQDANWPVVSRIIQIMENGFVRKRNSDALRLLIAAGYDRNLYVSDSQAPVGFTTKRLISLARTQMRRSGGGNYQSVNPIRLTDIFLSPEALEDIRSWDLTQIDDVTRREIFLAEQDGGMSRIFGVNLHEISELGEGQSLQQYFTALGGTFSGGDVELMIGLALNEENGACFVNPIKRPLEIFTDEALHRQRRMGWYGWLSHGLAILDSRRVVLMTA